MIFLRSGSVTAASPAISIVRAPIERSMGVQSGEEEIACLERSKINTPAVTNVDE